MCANYSLKKNKYVLIDWVTRVIYIYTHKHSQVMVFYFRDKTL